jgi:hypothetical protein
MEELRALDDLLRGETRVIHLHGIAGIGKSALVRRFVDRAEQAGVTVVELDCRTIEPTVRGFREAVVGGGDEDALFRHLKRLVPPVVLVLDHCELFRLMDTWLRQVLLPELPQDVGLLLAGRERPLAAWFTVGGFRSIPLGPLEDSEAQMLLGRLGVADKDVSRLNRIARGHPLALILAAAGMRERPDLSLEDAAGSRVVAELTRLYLSDIDDAASRQALEATSVVRRITEPLLAAMLAERSDIDQIVLKLLNLPFVTLAAMVWSCTRPYVTQLRNICAVPTRFGTGDINEPPGVNCAMKRAMRLPRNCGGTRRTCSISSTTR